MHDIGSIIYGRKDHHITSAKTAEEKLKEPKYPAEKIELIKKCILNHRGSQQNGRDSIEEQIIVEADVLSNFDNIAGIFKAAFIYENKTQGETKDSVRQKLERKWKQLYFENSKKIIKLNMKLQCCFSNNGTPTNDKGDVALSSLWSSLSYNKR